MKLYTKENWTHLKNWKNINFNDSITLASSGHLQPDTLEEAKFILCLYQRFAEQYNKEYKENRSIIKEALLSSTFEEFANIYTNLNDNSNWWLLCGLEHWLAKHGLLLNHRTTK